LLQRPSFSVGGSFRILKGREIEEAFMEGVNVVFTHLSEACIKAVIDTMREEGLVLDKVEWRGMFREVPYNEFVPETATCINYVYNSLHEERKGNMIIGDNPLTFIIVTPEAAVLFISEKSTQYLAFARFHKRERATLLKSKPPTTAQHVPPLIIRLGVR